MKKIILLLTVLPLLLLTGCATQREQQAKAVERAREYLLENAKELDSLQIDFVRYNDPFLLTAPVLQSQVKKLDGENYSSSKLSGRFHQICVTWQIPGADKLYLVYGVSDETMFYWYPERLLRKNFYSYQPPLWNAARLARNYALVNLSKQLTSAQYNLIRYDAPAVWQTDFPLTKTQEKGQQQFSLVWKIAPGQSAVFCGVSTSNLNDWEISFAGIIENGELKTHSKKLVRTPEEFQLKINGKKTERK